MYVKVDEIKARRDNVVIEIIKWPERFANTSLHVPGGNNRFDNGWELYLGKVKSSQSKDVPEGSVIAVDIYYGVHVPLVEKERKVKIVPASGILLTNKDNLKVMSDIIKMTPGKDRVLLKLRKKDNKTAGGLFIPEENLAQDPTAQDVRFADVLTSNDPSVKDGDVVVIEEFVGKQVYLDEEKFAYRVCYADDIIAVITDKN